MADLNFPRSQGELLRRARGDKTQAAFAKELGVSRSCLCRYEREQLGAPVNVINACLRSLAPSSGSQRGPLDMALEHARSVVVELESAASMARSAVGQAGRASRSPG
jgi:DNA-binding XRE family transcriptional regulator